MDTRSIPEPKDKIDQKEKIDTSDQDGRQNCQSSAMLMNYDFPNRIRIESQTGTPPPNRDQSFNSGEHSDIGNYSLRVFLDSLEDKSEFKTQLCAALKTVTREQKIFDPKTGKAAVMKIYEVELEDDLIISVGEVVALAGDFFGVANQPISFGATESDRQIRFKNAYMTLFDKTKHQDHIVRRLVNHMRSETEAAHSHFSFGLDFIKHKVEGSMSNIVYGIERAERGSVMGFWHSPYFDLSLMNFDHFGKDAQTAFLAGHRVAIQSARDAASEEDTQIKKTILKQALLQEMFACHFLTDLFAAGHIRTPRREILNYLIGRKLSDSPDLAAGDISHMNLVIAGLFAKKMHDQDSNGIYVKIAKDVTDQNNKESRSLLASGDGNFFNKSNCQYALTVSLTVVMALKDLLLAYEGRDTVLDDEKKLSLYIPQEDITRNNTMHIYPLFVKNEEKESISCLERDQGDMSVYNIILRTHTHIALVLGRLFTIRIEPTITEAAGTMKKTIQEKVGQLLEQLETFQISCNIS